MEEAVLQNVNALIALIKIIIIEIMEEIEKLKLKEKGIDIIFI